MIPKCWSLQLHLLFYILLNPVLSAPTSDTPKKYIRHATSYAILDADREPLSCLEIEGMKRVNDRNGILFFVDLNCAAWQESEIWRMFDDALQLMEYLSRWADDTIPASWGDRSVFDSIISAYIGPREHHDFVRGMSINHEPKT